MVTLLQLRHERGSMMSIACQPGQEVGQFWVEKSDGTLRAMQLVAVRAGTCNGSYTAAFQQSLTREERCYQVDIPRGLGEQLLGEFKSMFPYAPTPEGAFAYKWLPHKQPPATPPPHYFAQCQLQMLVLGVPECVLVYHTISKSKVFKLELDAEWCMSMLGVLSQLTRHYITPKVVPPVDFGQGLEGYTDFLDLTKKLCSKVSGQTLASLQTEPSAFKQQRFLDR